MLWQKWSIISLLLFILSCGDDEMAKPTLRGIWARGGTKVDVTSMADTGFQKTALEYAKLNGILYQQGEWADFVDRAFGKTYYVQCTSGSDTTGDGTSSYPFQTIKKAVDSIEDGGYGTVLLTEAGEYDIAADIDMYAKTVRVAINTSVLAADINFTSYTSSGENSLYGFNLYRGSNLSLYARNIDVDAPNDTGDDWVENIGAIRVYDQTSHVSISVETGISFSNTAATGADLPSLVVNAVNNLGFGTANLTIIGTITTNDKGYVLNARELLATINAFGTIDNVLYWLDGGLDEKQSTLISCVVGDTSAGGTTLSIRSGSESISAGTGTEAESKIADLLTDAYGNITAGDVAGFKTTAGGNLVLITAVISGDSAAVIIGDIKSTANTTTYADVTQGYIIKNVNIQTNISALK